MVIFEENKLWYMYLIWKHFVKWRCRRFLDSVDCNQYFCLLYYRSLTVRNFFSVLLYLHYFADKLPLVEASKPSLSCHHIDLPYRKKLNNFWKYLTYSNFEDLITFACLPCKINLPPVSQKIITVVVRLHGSFFESVNHSFCHGNFCYYALQMWTSAYLIRYLMTIFILHTAVTLMLTVQTPKDRSTARV